MDGRINVLAHDLFIDENSVLVVVALPRHKADQRVFAQADLAVLRGGAVRDHLPLDDGVALVNDGPLVDAGALVRAHKLDELVFVGGGFGGAHGDGIRRNALYHTAVFCQNAHAGIARGLVFHTGGHDGLFGNQQRHSLPLHVRAHQRAVRVVVLEERDHRRRHRHHHFRADIHVIDALFIYLQNLVAPAAGNARTDKAAFGVQLLVGLRNDIFVLHIGSHVDHFICHSARRFIHAAVRRLDEAVLIDLRKRGKIRDKADVRAFRRLDRAHAAVVRIVHVAHLKARAVTREAAGAQRRQPALVRELGEGVILIHKLRQRAGAKELLDGRHHRADVDQRLRGDNVHILRLQRHALAHHALHARKADAELVLQQLAHAADAAVAQMIDIVDRPHAVRKAVQIVDGSQNIVHRNRLADELIAVFLQKLLLLVHVARLVQNGAQRGKIDALVDAARGGLERKEVVRVHNAVGNDLYFLILQREKYNAHTGGLGCGRRLGADLFARGAEQFARKRRNDIARGNMSLNAAADGELFVHFIAAEAGDIVTARIKKQAVDVAGGALHRRRLARAQLAVGFQQALLLAAGGILGDGGLNALVLAEIIADLRIVAKAQRADEHRDGDLAVFIDPDIKYIVGVRLVFQPRAAVRVQRSGEQLLACFVVAFIKIHARRAHQLRNNNALGAVDDERAGIRHERKIAHKDLLLLHLAGLLI